MFHLPATAIKIDSQKCVSMRATGRAVRRNQIRELARLTSLGLLAFQSLLPISFHGDAKMHKQTARSISES